MFAHKKIYITFAFPFTNDVREKRKRALSSAGSEHLVYTEGVGGSNPSAPTKPNQKWLGFFVFIPFYSVFELFFTGQFYLQRYIPKLGYCQQLT